MTTVQGALSPAAGAQALCTAPYGSFRCPQRRNIAPAGQQGLLHSSPRPQRRRCSGSLLVQATAAPMPPQQQQQQQAPSRGSSRSATSTSSRRAYPFIDKQFPGVTLVHAEPPVYVVHDFLSAADCQLLRHSAEAGQLQPLAYDNSVLVDVHRLWPLLLVVAAGAGFDAWHTLMAADAAAAGSGAAGGPTDLSFGTLAAAAGPALLRWGTAVGGLLGLVMIAMRSAVGGRVFTGTKWTAAQLDPAHPTAPVFSRFLGRTCRLLRTSSTQLEPPTVTRYQQGQYQRMHFDARPDGDPDGLQEFLQAGGQRLVQVVVYLNSLSAEQGGGTHFFHPTLKGLTVQPQQGDALVFFPAFEDGGFDDRMAHSGQVVRDGEKWILNTWACQRAVPSAATHLTPLANDSGAGSRSTTASS